MGNVELREQEYLLWGRICRDDRVSCVHEGEGSMAYSCVH